MSFFQKTPKQYLACDFDIEQMQVYAIERDNDAGETVIGYYFNGTCQEWHLPCSEEKHEELYQRYKRERNRLKEAHGQPLIP